MNYKEIKDLIDLMRSTDVAEIEVERAGKRIRIRRGGAAAPPPPPPPSLSSGPPEQAEEASAAKKAVPSMEEPGILRSPLVGTFFHAPSPDSKPFVEIGDAVEKGQVLCIVEAMKLMNEIEAEHAGVVREIFAENGQPVEYGQPLFRIASED